ncbi:hypothetical protein E4K72_05010 [Oxalobacteraceae bacterium OM1]|nr:hypothetical protein E4K72_05010 [Oxalobacteraceae bacterium OM1]
MDIEFGDAAQLDTRGTGWFVGYSDWVRDASPTLRYMPHRTRAQTLCMKWMQHETGDPNGTGKPRSEGRTMSILVSERGRFRLQFSRHEHFPPGDTVEHVLERHGHFCAWGEGIFHRWYADEACTLLTLRWIPESGRA